MRYRLIAATLIITGIAIFGLHQVSAQQIPSKDAAYSDDFSSYTPGSPPSGWILRGADQVIPTVKDVGGTGPSHRLVDFPEVPWQYWGRTLLKDGLIPHAPYTVTVRLNFQNKVADGAGLTIAWNDTNGNRIEIIPNVYHNEIVPSVTYKGPIQSNVSWRTAVEYIPISPFTNYWLRVEVKDDRPGQGQLSVLWSTDGTKFIQVKSATGLQDLRGLVGVSTVGPHLPHVYFDDFVVSEAPLAAELTNVAPTACMFYAPNGPDVWPVGKVIGHVGWAFRDGGEEKWFFGATENTKGEMWIDPGDPADTQSWQKTGTWAQVLRAFRTGENFNTGPNYYQSYRCITINANYPDIA